MAQAVARWAWVRSLRCLAIVAGLSFIGFGTLYAVGGHRVRSKQITATSAAPTAHGKAHLTIQSSRSEGEWIGGNPRARRPLS